MAVEDHPNFKKWDKANRRWRTRQEWYRAVKDIYPSSHPLVKAAKKAVEEAAHEVAEITADL